MLLRDTEDALTIKRAVSKLAASLGVILAPPYRPPFPVWIRLASRRRRLISRTVAIGTPVTSEVHDTNWLNFAIDIDLFRVLDRKSVV